MFLTSIYQKPRIHNLDFNYGKFAIIKIKLVEWQKNINRRYTRKILCFKVNNKLFLSIAIDNIKNINYNLLIVDLRRQYMGLINTYFIEKSEVIQLDDEDDNEIINFVDLSDDTYNNLDEALQTVGLFDSDNIKQFSKKLKKMKYTKSVKRKEKYIYDYILDEYNIYFNQL